MTARLPLVIGSSGHPEQLQSGDTLAGGGSGLATGSALIDFGATPVADAVVTITDAAISAASFVQAYVTPEASADNSLSDHLHAGASWKLICVPADGSFDLYISCLMDLCWGTFNISYSYQ